MDRSQWLGLVLGVVLGAGYGVWQQHGMRAARVGRKPARAMLAAVARVAGLLAGLFLAVRLAAADRYWLIGSVMVSYAVVFVWSLRNVMFGRN
jgi:hypothetical protein